MGLDEKERAEYERLTRKSKEPDAPPISRSVSGTVDFSNPKSVELAIEHGFLTRKEAEEEKEKEKGDKDKKEDESPRRRSYFGD